MSERSCFKSEYIQSFVFGVKLLSLLCLLLVPPVLFAVTISLGSQLIQNLPLLNKSGLSIISAQSFPYQPDDPLGIRKAEKQPTYTLKVNSNSGVSFDLYVKTNRATTGSTEYGQLKEQAERILNDDRVIHFVPDDKMGKPGPEGHFELDGIPDYLKIVVPTGTTFLGGLVNVVGLIGVAIFCLALYFPLTKGIVDLFRHRRTIKQ